MPTATLRRREALPVPQIQSGTPERPRLHSHAGAWERENNASNTPRPAQTRVDHLTQSILAKAFRGELTADWREHNPDLISSENSAQALLARIRAERAKHPPVKRRRKPATSP